MSGRILHCIPGMGGGGAERQLAYLAGPLRELGWELHVALVSAGPNLDRLLRGGATVHRIAAHGNYDPRILWQLARLVRHVAPDLVQLWLFQMEVAGALAAASNGIPWLLSERSSEAAYPSRWRSTLRRAVGSRAAAIVANSAAGERYWARQRVTAPRFVVPNAVPHEEIESATPAELGELGLQPDHRLVLFVGRFSLEKNTRILLEALKALLAAEPRTVAVLGGDGPLRAELDSLRAALPTAARMALPGYLEQPWSWMKRAAVFVSIATFEGHPNAVLEAAACRTPMVLSDIPAHRAILDGTCVIFVRPDDPAAVASAIRAVLLDADAAAVRAARAAERVAHLSVRNIAQHYDRIYRLVGAGARLDCADRGATVESQGVRR